MIKLHYPKFIWNIFYIILNFTEERNTTGNEGKNSKNEADNEDGDDDDDDDDEEDEDITEEEEEAKEAEEKLDQKSAERIFKALSSKILPQLHKFFTKKVREKIWSTFLGLVSPRSLSFAKHFVIQVTYYQVKV